MKQNLGEVRSKFLPFTSALMQQLNTVLVEKIAPVMQSKENAAREEKREARGTKVGILLVVQGNGAKTTRRRSNRKQDSRFAL